MDKVQKIREEVERRYRENKADGYSDVCEELWDILSFIDSMQEEPVRESINFEQELYKAFGQVKDFTLCMRIAKRFYDIGKKSREPVNKQNLSNVERTGKDWKEEPVSEDLEEAAKNVGQKYFPDEYNVWARPNYEAVKAECAFKACAQWQKKQMMTKAIDGKVIANGMGNPILHLWDKGKYLIDKKVKVIVIKED